MTEVRFACIGSRTAPAQYLELMREIGKLIAKGRDIVVSGNCKGSDQAYSAGANAINPARVVLHLPWKTYEQKSINELNTIHIGSTSRGLELAERHHPYWKNLKSPARALLGRNAEIILNSDYVFAYMDTSKKGGGGTGHGWRISDELKLEKCNLLDVEFSKEEIHIIAENLYKKALKTIKREIS